MDDLTKNYSNRVYF